MLRCEAITYLYSLVLLAASFKFLDVLKSGWIVGLVYFKWFDQLNVAHIISSFNIVGSFSAMLWAVSGFLLAVSVFTGIADCKLHFFGRVEVRLDCRTNLFQMIGSIKRCQSIWSLTLLAVSVWCFGLSGFLLAVSVFTGIADCKLQFFGRVEVRLDCRTHLFQMIWSIKRCPYYLVFNIVGSLSAMFWAVSGLLFAVSVVYVLLYVLAVFVLPCFCSFFCLTLSYLVFVLFRPWT